MELRGIYVPWDLALKERERPLDDLSAWTRLNTIMLVDTYSSMMGKNKLSLKRKSSQLVLPSATRFGMRARTVTEAKFTAMMDFVALAKLKRFRIACIAAPLFISGGKDSMGCVNFVGKTLRGPGDFAFYGCPNNPDVIDYGQTMTSGFVESWPHLDYLSLDHLEYPLNLFTFYPAVDLRNLFVCFCGWCQEKADEDGLDLGKVKKEIGSLYDFMTSSREWRSNPLRNPESIDILRFLIARPLLTPWLNFRMKSMTEYAKRLVQASRRASRKNNPSLKIGFYFQLPTVSHLVGTDYTSLSPLFDYVCPKFADYIPGATLPVIADAIASQMRARGKKTLRSIMRQLLDLGPGPKHYRSLGGFKDSLLYSNATDPSMIDRQIKYIQDLTKRAKVVPHIWEHNGDIKCVREKRRALERRGFDSYTIWAFEDGLSRKNLRAAKGIL